MPARRNALFFWAFGRQTSLQKSRKHLDVASRVLRCEGRAYEDAEALHGWRRVCTRHGYLLRAWWGGVGFQRGRSADPGDRTAGPAMDRERGCGRLVVLRGGLVDHPDGVFGDRRAGGFLRHPSIGWTGDDSGADSRRRRVDAGDGLAPDP